MAAFDEAPGAGAPATKAALAPVVVISLVKATDRRERIARRFAELGVPFSFFDAVYGREMPAEAIAALDPRPIAADYGRAFSPGELGCAASFIAVLKRFLAGTEPFLCVMEDDSFLAATFPAFLDRDWLASLPAFDLLRLHNKRGKTRHRPLSALLGLRAGHQLRVPMRIIYGATGQVFSREGARRALAALHPLVAPIDHILYRDPGSRLRIIEVIPRVVLPAPGESTIGNARLTHPKPPWWRPARRIRRIAVQMKRRALAWPVFLQLWGVQRALRLDRPPEDAPQPEWGAEASRIIENHRTRRA